MPTDPLQLTLAVLEYTLVFGGAGLALWLLATPRQRQRWLGLRPLPPLALSLSEFTLAAALIFLAGFAGGAVAQTLFNQIAARTTNHAGLQVIVINLSSYAGAFIGWRVMFPAVLRSWQTGPGLPPPRPARPPLTWSESTGYAIGTVLVALPLVYLLTLGWTALLQSFGVPAAPQDLVAIVAKTQSPVVIAGLILVTCGFGPAYEELLFRAGLYRYIRQKLGRTPALLISGVGFGVMHLDVTAFLPLAALGMLLAVVYEATGSIRVTIIAHGLFNLNSIIFVLAGFFPANP